MKLNAHSCKVFLVALFSLGSFYANSQKLIESRQSSYYTYIYKLTDKEAKKIYKNDIGEIEASFFHSLVDSFPTDGQYDNRLHEGHYIKTFSEKNQQKVAITTVQDFDVFILNNNTDLCVQVYDLQGNIITDSKVKVRWKNLHFDKKTQSYLDKKSNQKGLLKVTHHGFTAYYNLSRQYDNSNIRRGTRKIIYGTPVKYVWMPVNFIIHLPIDAVKSVASGWPQGTIGRAKNFFVQSFHKVACIFDDYYCDYYSNDKFERKHTGYIVFNKPKYQPGDTVKFKAFLVTKRGKPVHKPVKVILQTYKKDTELTKLLPYRKGGYEYQFFLHDSLQLQLDRSYYIALALNDEKEFIRGSFAYEDYELAKNKLSLRLDETSHYRNKEIKLYAKGTDENDLNLLDARIEVLVKPVSINKYFSKHVFTPDTLLFFEKKLEPVEETEIIIPDAAFPAINFEYEIIVRLLTADNEAISESREIHYYHNAEEFRIELLTDSLLFTFSKNGISDTKNATITANDNFGNTTPLYNGSTPCKIVLNPYYASYTIQSDSISETIDISSQLPLLQCLSERTKDSVFIVIDNPRQLPFTYNIYRKNNERWAGFSDSLNIQQKSAAAAASKQNYFVSIRYLWGGQVNEENYSIPFLDKKLNVAVMQPKIVYPGQQSQIEVLVTDTEGKPVEGVDVTAYSMTKKFNYSPPALPYLGKTRKDKTLINNFHFEDFDLDVHSGLDLDYEAWKLLAGLDSIEYYKFLYPENSFYTFEYQTADSLTQFAPFVVSNGAVQPIHVIYVDSKPVYFSWSTHTQPYSFKIDSGYHQIKLRTSDRSITIDSLFFSSGKKLIFSLTDNWVSQKVKIEKAEPELSASEQKLLYKYIFPYRNTFGERVAYLQQEDEIQYLHPQLSNPLNNFAGPIAGNVSFHLLDSFTPPNLITNPFLNMNLLRIC